MPKSNLLGAFLGIGLVLCAAEKKPVTLADVAASRPSGAEGEITWAPGGKAFVYQQDQSLFLYELGRHKAHELVSTKTLSSQAVKTEPNQPFSWENRRVTTKPVQWFPDGKRLLLAVEGDLFIWDLDTSASTQLTKTSATEYDPLLSPDGKTVAFRRGADLYAIDVASKHETRLTSDGSASVRNAQLDWVYPEELELGTADWWSPDSRSIAYLQFDISAEETYPQVDILSAKARPEPERYPQAGSPNARVRLGVVSLETGKTRWMDVSADTNSLLARVVWSPDSRLVAAEKLNRVQDHLELIFSDTETGKGTTVLDEKDKTWINVADDFQFLPATHQFLWSSERSGFRHLYVYSMDGTPVRQITSGDWEVANVAAVDQKTQTIYYVSTEDSPLERHLYAVQFDGSGRRKLTKEPGMHTVVFSPDSASYLDSYSSQRLPVKRVLHSSDGSEIAVYRQPDEQAQKTYNLLPAEIFTMEGADHTKLYGRLVKPAGFKPGKKYPAIVMVYGGPHAQTIHNSWSGVSWEQALAQKGFVVWQLDNRGSGGRGHIWESALYRRFGKTELEDQLTGVQHLLSMGFVDPGKVGIYGWSYGGYMTLYSLLNSPGTFKAGVAGAPVTNWRNYDTIYTERYLGLPDENSRGYDESSPITMAANLESKLMIVHNIEDDNVLFQNTLQMSNALQQAGKLFQLQIYPQKSHGVTGKARLQMLETITNFFEENLK